MAPADLQDCDCDEGCYYCMIILKLKVSYLNGQQGQFMSVTSDMLEVVPSPGGVSFCFPGSHRQRPCCSSPAHLSRPHQILTATNAINLNSRRISRSSSPTGIRS